MNLDKISRIEVIGPDGREYVRYLKDGEFIYTMVQDDGRTLKYIIEHERDGQDKKLKFGSNPF